MTKQEVTQVDTLISKTFETLSKISDGDLMYDLSLRLQECVKAAQNTGKKCTLNLAILIDPDTKAAGVFRVSGAIKLKLPPEPTKASLFFPTPEGNLSRNDWRQREMFDERQQQYQQQ